MKTNTLSALSLLLMILLWTGCTKDNSTTADNNAFNAAIGSGTWGITSFTQRTENKTSDFAGMDFTFSTNGTMTVKGSQTATGTWSYSAPTTGTYGGSSSPATFTMNIVAGSAIAKLSRSWNVGSNSATTLQLNHPEAAEDEHVTFTKK